MNKVYLALTVICGFLLYAAIGAGISTAETSKHSVQIKAQSCESHSGLIASGMWDQ
jgi:hypothetical protein